MPVNPIDPIGRSIEVVDDEKRPTQELNIFTEEVSEMAENLSNVDNTSDADKPVSTAQQTALDTKAAKAANLSDLTSASTARTNLGLGTAAVADILGTVSQSGGIPTGAIIESGSNANGAYVRWADGTQICVLSNFAITLSTAANAPIFFGVASWTFPIAFSTTTNLFVTGSPSSSGIAQWGGRALNITTTAADIVYLSERDRGAIFGRNMAIGRWF